MQCSKKLWVTEYKQITMADPVENDASAEPVAEQTDAAIAAEVKPEAEPAPAPVETAAKAPAKATAPAPKPVAKPAKASAKPSVAPAPVKASIKTTTAGKTSRPGAKRPIRVPTQRKPSPRLAATSALSVTELKEKIMAAKTSPFTLPFPTDLTGVSKTMTDAVSEMQAKAQAAYDKGTGLVAEMTDLAKGNAEAMVESGKILATGLQDLGKTYAAEAKTGYETLTGDLKEMAAVKSPTELFQLQGTILRRNFDAMVAAASKSSEVTMKLANETFAPLSARVNLAVEKLSKAA